MERALDLVVFGATGFTGRLVAEVLQGARQREQGLRWALAGRQAGRLAEVRDAIGAPADLPLLTADAADPASLAALVAKARVVISTVGPYQQHGEPLLRACAAAGTDYVDLCGEPLWMADMIPALQGAAADSGARLVFSCGFDSIPFDLGVVFLQTEMVERFGAPAAEVRGRVRVMKGAMSGGTAASAMGTMARIAREPELAATLADSFALTPGFRGPPQPPLGGAVYDDWAKAWTSPFVMASINTKNVHRSNLLRGHPWGTDFVYDERQLCGDGAGGRQRAQRFARQDRVQQFVLRQGLLRRLVQRYMLPQPGQGPDRAAREAGRYEVAFTGQTAAGQRLTAVVRGAGDPGYGSTSRMIVEAALTLLREVGRGATPGGVWTPGAAMGLALARRLEEHAGLSFEIEG